jgi:hypothetical protein
MVIHSIAGAQSQVATQHVISHELLAFFSGPSFECMAEALGRGSWVAVMSASAAALTVRQVVPEIAVLGRVTVGPL